jgi:glucose/mannose transport system permease protein
MDYLFERQNIGIATAASVCMLITVLAILSPWMYAEHIRPRMRQRRIG